jgi:hypothetical protein
VKINVNILKGISEKWKITFPFLDKNECTTGVKVFQKVNCQIKFLWKVELFHST